MPAPAPRVRYLFLATLSLTGLVASAVFHGLAYLDLQPPGGTAAFVALHLGIFPLWIPLVVFAERTMPTPRRGGNLDHLFEQLPRWTVRTVAAFGIYALLNFGWFLYQSRQYPKHEVPEGVMMRGFSGHWMIFYAVATAGFVGLARFTRGRKEPGAPPPPQRGPRNFRR